VRRAKFPAFPAAKDKMSVSINRRLPDDRARGSVWFKRETPSSFFLIYYRLFDGKGNLSRTYLYVGIPNFFIKKKYYYSAGLLSLRTDYPARAFGASTEKGRIRRKATGLSFSTAIFD
jgi:hypothetical protein